MFTHFYTDDKTGEFSSTQLRTNILFTLFVVFALFLTVITICLMFSALVVPNERSLSWAFDLLVALGTMSGVGGGLYLGKRINETRPIQTSGVTNQNQVDIKKGE